ncbi:MAG: roadblock/LC7 domain-containing protein [Promethearchaeia archaeon]
MSAKTEMLRELLEDLSRASQGNIEASIIISRSQGLPIYSWFPEDSSDDVPTEDVIAGRSMQIQMETRKVFNELERGSMVRMLIEGNNGYAIICGAGDEAILSVLTNKRVNLGYLFFMMSRIAKGIESAIA